MPARVSTRRGLHFADALLAQGVTTIVINPDGGGPVDLEAQRARMRTLGIGVNVAPLVGHGAIRGSVMGGESRAPTAVEREQMREAVRVAMRAGAFGLSSGLFYTPGAYAADRRGDGPDARGGRDAGPRSAVHTSHIRDEGTYSIGVLAAVDEIIAIAEGSGTTGHRHAHEGARTRCLGPDARVRGAHRGRPRPRRGGLGRSVSVRGVGHEPVRGAHPARGASRRTEGVGRTARRSRQRAALLPLVRREHPAARRRGVADGGVPSARSQRRGPVARADREGARRLRRRKPRSRWWRCTTRPPSRSTCRWTTSNT